MDYRFLPLVEEEITESAVFYENESEGLGADFLDEIDRAILRICEIPEIGQIYSPNLRRFVLARFPYSILYSVKKVC